MRGVDFGVGGAHEEVYDAIALAKRDFVLRYLGTHTREEAEWAKDRGLRCGHIWQNGHSEEVWHGYQGEDPGWPSGRAAAEDAKAKQHPIAGCKRPIFFTLDKANTSEKGKWPLSVGIEYLKGARSVLGQRYVGVYGSGMTIKRIMALNYPPVSYYWLSWLLDGIYDGKRRTELDSLPRKVHFLQWANSDRDTALPRFKMDHDTPYYSYVGHDRTTPNVSYRDVLWQPV